jgi:hypothetical protein
LRIFGAGVDGRLNPRPHGVGTKLDRIRAMNITNACSSAPAEGLHGRDEKGARSGRPGALAGLRREGNPAPVERVAERMVPRHE